MTDEETGGVVEAWRVAAAAAVEDPRPTHFLELIQLCLEHGQPSQARAYLSAVEDVDPASLEGREVSVLRSLIDALSDEEEGVWL